MSHPRALFAEHFIRIDGVPFSFAGRSYLRALYASNARNLVVRASRQVEKTTLLANLILHHAVTVPRSRQLYVCPRQEQAGVFSRLRLLSLLNDSPLVKRVLTGDRSAPPAVTNLEFKNGSVLHVRAAFHSADSCRGLSCDRVLVDEFQDVAAGDLPVIQEVLSHAPRGRTILAGTPKTVDNHLDAMFARSTANEWRVTCDACQQANVLDERVLGAEGLQCSACQGLLDATHGAWHARNPDASWGDGFWICHLMVPWLNYADVLERQRTYDLVRFRNEVLGLPVTLGEHMVTREELEACCTTARMVRALRDVPSQMRPWLVAGVDWGGGRHSRTAITLGYHDAENVFHVVRMERIAANEQPQQVVDHVARLCNDYRVPWVAADGGGNGHVYNHMLRDRLNSGARICGLLYSAVSQRPVRDGRLCSWTVDRSASIGALFARIKEGKISLPQQSEVGTFFEEFTCEIAEFDTERRTVRYTHGENQLDDALHATNYCLLVALYRRSGGQLIAE